MVIQEQQGLYFTPLTLAHIPQVLPIEQDAYPEPWTFNMLHDEINRAARYFCLMYEEGGALLGYGGFWILIDEAHITRITIAKEYQGRGLSKLLMKHLQQEAEASDVRYMRLEVRENNIPAIRLYNGLNFVQDGMRKGYYRHTNENAILMSKELGIGNCG